MCVPQVGQPSLLPLLDVVVAVSVEVAEAELLDPVPRGSEPVVTVSREDLQLNINCQLSRHSQGVWRNRLHQPDPPPEPGLAGPPHCRH